MSRVGGTPDDVAQRNAAWAEALIGGLVDAGVRRLLVSPGSRSTPLTIAAARDGRPELIVHYDERGAGFHALGIARASRTPAALICTSGTSAANYLPAVAEAAYAAVPLIVLTADRPSELVDTGANQTVRQSAIYGMHARWSLDLPCPAPELPERAAYAVAQDAVRRSLDRPAGPVHLNVPFREPLIALGRPPRVVSPLASAPTPYETPQRLPSPRDLDDLAQLLAEARRPCLVAGGGLSSDDAAAIAALAHTLGCPLLADVLSGLRTNGVDALTCYDLLLLADAWREAFRPDLVIRFGMPPLSKRLSRRLAELDDAARVLVATDVRRLDPDLTITRRIDGDPPLVCAGLCERLAATGETARWAEWTAYLAQRDRQAHDGTEEHARTLRRLDEPAAVRIALETLAPGDAAFLANSLPVRHADLLGTRTVPAAGIHANRGASGIDGNVATAAGVARVVTGRVVAVVGDLAALHDLNSFALLRTASSTGAKPRVTLLVINNDGGGIFHLLPVSRETDVFEAYFATPHGMDFSHAAAQFSLPYACVRTPDALHNAMARSDASSVVEVRTDRAELAETAAVYRRIAQRAAGAR